MNSQRRPKGGPCSYCACLALRIMNTYSNPPQTSTRAGIATTENTDLRTDRLFVSLLIIASLVALLVRIDDLSYVTESLYGEDAWLLIAQAHELGIRSVFEPFAGYLWLYPRLVALLTLPLPLVAAPYVFFVAWLLTFFAIATILRDRAKRLGLGELLIIFLTCAIALQPSHGEIFFTLNLSTYTLGLALAFHVCIPTQRRASVSTHAFLILASLSGPFSTLMIPVLTLQWAILRDFSARRSTYLIVPLCGVIQSIFLVQRAHATSNHASTADWLHAVAGFLFFGGSNRLTYAAAAIFWVILLVFLLKWTTTQALAASRAQLLSPSVSALTALLLYFTMAMSTQYLFDRLSPIGINSRYFFIPYSLLFFAALACTRHNRSAQTATIALISTICGAGFLAVDREERASHTEPISHYNLQWTAFTKFWKIRPDIAIPVNPSLPMYPPFRLELKQVSFMNEARTEATTPILLNPQHGMAGGSSTEVDSAFYFDIKDHCKQSEYLAFEIAIWRANMGWARISWGTPGSFGSERSLERFYLGGDSVMHFAFRRNLSEDVIRLEPAEGVGTELVQALDPAREAFRQAGYILAEATKAGGEVKIRAVRLFCLQ